MWKIAIFAVTKLIVVATMFLPVAQADIVSTSSYLERQAIATQAINAQTIETQRAEIRAELQRDEVRQQLADMGVEPATLEARLAGLSDAEVVQMASDMDEMPAGANMGSMTLVLLIILLIVLL